MKALKANAEDSSQGRIGRGVDVSGDVFFGGVLHVDGKVAGRLISETGTLLIEHTGEVHAEVEAAACVIRGLLRGNLNMRSRVEVSRTGRIHGDVKTPVLVVEEGAQLSGTVSMTDEPEPEAEELRAPETQPLRKSQITL
jgi:cytoskeletal protein CcmA (bactofilin family)